MDLRLRGRFMEKVTIITFRLAFLRRKRLYLWEIKKSSIWQSDMTFAR